MPVTSPPRPVAAQNRQCPIAAGFLREAAGHVPVVTEPAASGLHAGWVSVATVVGTAATGQWLGLPGEGTTAVVLVVLAVLVRLTRSSRPLAASFG